VSSGVGFEVGALAGGHAELLSEAPSRAVACLAAHRVDEVAARAEAAGVPLTVLGRAGGHRLVVDGLVDVGLPEATHAWRNAIAELAQPV
jgi:uncharacterized heparinase superfamily protein